MNCKQVDEEDLEKIMKLLETVKSCVIQHDVSDVYIISLVNECIELLK